MVRHIACLFFWMLALIVGMISHASAESFTVEAQRVSDLETNIWAVVLTLDATTFSPPASMNTPDYFLEAIGVKLLSNVNVIESVVSGVPGATNFPATTNAAGCGPGAQGSVCDDFTTHLNITTDPLVQVVLTFDLIAGASFLAGTDIDALYSGTKTTGPIGRQRHTEVFDTKHYNDVALATIDGNGDTGRVPVLGTLILIAVGLATYGSLGLRRAK